MSVSLRFFITVTAHQSCIDCTLPCATGTAWHCEPHDNPPESQSCLEWYFWDHSNIFTCTDVGLLVEPGNAWHVQQSFFSFWIWFFRQCLFRGHNICKMSKSEIKLDFSPGFEHDRHFECGIKKHTNWLKVWEGGCVVPKQILKQNMCPPPLIKYPYHIWYCCDSFGGVFFLLNLGPWSSEVATLHAATQCHRYICLRFCREKSIIIMSGTCVKHHFTFAYNMP